MSKRKISRSVSAGKKSRNCAYVIMMLPFLIFFGLFMVVPIISSIALSFTDFNMVQWPKFVGFENFSRIFFEDEIFMISFKNTLVFACTIGPIGYILSFVVAWLINELGRKTRTLLTFMMYSPALAGNVFVIWTYIFSSDRRGFLNNLLINLGVTSDPINWLTNTKYNFMVVIIVSIWLSFGVGFLSFVSGLQALDRSYYEAAAIDGLKNRWQELYYVTFPQIGPQLLFGAVTSISSAFAVGSVGAVLTGNPSTDYSTHTIVLHMGDYATTRYEMGYASALSVVLFAMVLIAWFLINKVLRKFTA